jgi:hypothetical protein
MTIQLPRSIALATVTLALAAPVALASPTIGAVQHLSEEEAQVLASRGQSAPAPETRPARTVAASGGFEWGTAGLGAAASAALLLFGATGVSVTRRARPRVAR